MNRARLRVIFLLLCISLEVEKIKSCGPGPVRVRKKSPLQPMILKQKYPDLPEVSEGASGATTGKIARNSPRFKQLVKNLNTNIIFKDEEGTGADRYMSKRCQKKLDKLGTEVKKKWPGLKLRVIEAWDEDNHHDSDSLHYEGRAVDITTSDRDRSKFGILGKLAVDVGFDWVLYEARSHIHASVRKDSDENDFNLGCFSANSTVRLENGRTVQMSELRVGDKVASRDDNGQIVYSDVLLFLDRNPKPDSDLLYFIIETESPKTQISLTPNHLIYTQDSNLTNAKPNIKFARYVQRDEYLYIEQNGEILLSKVTQIHTKFLEGAYAPLTRHGNIIVDNVLSSCYSLVGDHHVAQTIFAPLRFLHAFTPSFLLDSSKQNGLHWLSQLLYQINSLLNYAGVDFL